MWILRAKFFDKENKLSLILRKNRVKIHYYPSNHYIKNNRYYFVAIGMIEGKDEDKKRYFNELKKLKRERKGRKLELLETEGDLFIAITSHSIDQESKLFVSIAYNPALIHFKPVVWHQDGWEEWSIASMNRGDLVKLIDIAEKKYQMQLLELKQRKIKNFGFLTILPELTDKQKQAIKLAIEKGYYTRPRKTDVQKLAKISSVAFSAFQAHLRKAENKIIPSLFGNL